LSSLAEEVRTNALRDGNIDPIGLVRLEGAASRAVRALQLGDNETVYATSIGEVFGGGDEPSSGPDLPDRDDPRLRRWQEEIEGIIEERHQRRPIHPEAPEPHCAWYCPIHFFGHGAGIYIRESCIEAGWSRDHGGILRPGRQRDGPD
jgi:hypothetical protein